MQQYYTSPLAEQDIDDIVTYIAGENIDAADKFLDAFFDAVSKLVDNPEMGHRREDLTSHRVKFWTFKWYYLIIYRPIKPLEIVRVLSGYRDIANMMI